MSCFCSGGAGFSHTHGGRGLVELVRSILFFVWVGLSVCLAVCLSVTSLLVHFTAPGMKLFSTSSRIDTSGIRIPGQQDRPAVRLRARQRLGCNPAQAVRSLVSIGSVPRRPQEQNYDQSQQAKPTTNHRRRHHDHGLGPTATTTF